MSRSQLKVSSAPCLNFMVCPFEPGRICEFILRLFKVEAGTIFFEHFSQSNVFFIVGSFPLFPNVSRLGVLSFFYIFVFTYRGVRAQRLSLRHGPLQLGKTPKTENRLRLIMGSPVALIPLLEWKSRYKNCFWPCEVLYQIIGALYSQPTVTLVRSREVK